VTARADVVEPMSLRIGDLGRRSSRRRARAASASGPPNEVIATPANAHGPIG